MFLRNKNQKVKKNLKLKRKLRITKQKLEKCQHSSKSTNSELEQKQIKTSGKNQPVQVNDQPLREKQQQKPLLQQKRVEVLSDEKNSQDQSRKETQKHNEENTKLISEPILADKPQLQSISSYSYGFPFLAPSGTPIIRQVFPAYDKTFLFEIGYYKQVKNCQNFFSFMHVQSNGAFKSILFKGYFYRMISDFQVLVFHRNTQQGKWFKNKRDNMHITTWNLKTNQIHTQQTKVQIKDNIDVQVFPKTKIICFYTRGFFNTCTLSYFQYPIHKNSQPLNQYSVRSFSKQDQVGVPFLSCKYDFFFYHRTYTQNDGKISLPSVQMKSKFHVYDVQGCRTYTPTCFDGKYEIYSYLAPKNITMINQSQLLLEFNRSSLSVIKNEFKNGYGNAVGQFQHYPCVLILWNYKMNTYRIVRPWSKVETNIQFSNQFRPYNPQFPERYSNNYFPVSIINPKTFQTVHHRKHASLPYSNVRVCGNLLVDCEPNQHATMSQIIAKTQEVGTCLYQQHY